MTTDTFGVTKLVETVPGGKEWFSTTFTDDPPRSYTNPPDPSWNDDEYDSNIHYRVTDSTASIASGEITIFGNSPRIFVTGPWVNTEFTCYVKRTGDASTVKYSHLGSRSNHDIFDQNNRRCGFGRYNVKFNHYINRVASDKESLHPVHIVAEQDGNDWTEGITQTTWAGLKTIVRTDRLNGRVLVQGYVDHTEAASGGTWTKLTEWYDDGTVAMYTDMLDGEDVMSVYVTPCMGTSDLNCPLWASASGIPTSSCKPLASNMQLPFFSPGEFCWIRTQEVTADVKYKWISVREIPYLT